MTSEMSRAEKWQYSLRNLSTSNRALLAIALHRAFANAYVGSSFLARPTSTSWITGGIFGSCYQALGHPDGRRLRRDAWGCARASLSDYGSAVTGNSAFFTLWGCSIFAPKRWHTSSGRAAPICIPRQRTMSHGVPGVRSPGCGKPTLESLQRDTQIFFAFASRVAPPTILCYSGIQSAG